MEPLNNTQQQSIIDSKSLNRSVNPNTPKTIKAAMKLFIKQPSPRILILTCLFAMVWRIYLGGFHLNDLYIIAAIFLLWPLQEWVVHRFILHMKPMNIAGRKVEPIQARNHRLHHEDPWRLDVLFVYKGVFKYGIPTVIGLFWLLFQSWHYAVTATAAYFFVVLRYEWTHYLIHSEYKPKSEWYKKRYINHRRHHFSNMNKMFGVTSIMADRLLGTSNRE